MSTELTRRELRAVVDALAIARDQTVNDNWRWWHDTRYAAALYERLRRDLLKAQAA